MLVPEGLLHGVELAVRRASPSMVRTSRPSACTANIVQLLTALPSSITVQAPQIEVSQPMCGPGQAGHLAQVVDQQQARLDLVGIRLSVDRESDLLFHGAHPGPEAGLPSPKDLIKKLSPRPEALTWWGGLQPANPSVARVAPSRAAAERPESDLHGDGRARLHSRDGEIAGQ